MGKRLSGGMQLRFEGGERFERQMKQAAKDVRKEYLREMREIAKDWRSETRSALPRQSGEARRQLKHFARGSKDGAQAGLRSGLVYHPALHFARRGAFGATMRRRYGDRPRFSYDVRDDNAETYYEQMQQAIARVVERVYGVER